MIYTLYLQPIEYSIVNAMVNPLVNFSLKRKHHLYERLRDLVADVLPPFLAPFFALPLLLVPFFALPFFTPPFLALVFLAPPFFGTFAPSFLASDKPIAIAC